MPLDAATLDEIAMQLTNEINFDRDGRPRRAPHFEGAIEMCSQENVVAMAAERIRIQHPGGRGMTDGQVNEGAFQIYLKLIACGAACNPACA